MSLVIVSHWRARIKTANVRHPVILSSDQRHNMCNNHDGPPPSSRAEATKTKRKEKRNTHNTTQQEPPPTHTKQSYTPPPTTTATDCVLEGAGGRNVKWRPLSRPNRCLDSWPLLAVSPPRKPGLDRPWQCTHALPPANSRMKKSPVTPMRRRHCFHTAAAAAVRTRGS